MSETELTALVIGATGLVGTQLVNQLLDDGDYTSVVTFGRRGSDRVHPKLTHHRVDFENPDSWSSLLVGDILFSAMGTTLKVAGSKEAQWRVDYDYQYAASAIARRNGVRKLVLVSSTGADPKSSMFYLRMKGQLESAVLELGYPQVSILRPSMLDGQRKEHRPGEKWGLKVARLVPDWDSLARIRPVHVSTVARAARRAARREDGTWFWEAKDIQRCEG